MLGKVQCEYCNKNVIKRNLPRHLNTKECRNKQQNKNIKSQLNEYICKFCEISFNRLDNKNEHELNCQFKNMYYKMLNKITEKENELKSKENEINIYKEENSFLKSQLQIYKPNINYIGQNTNITINNNININFGDIRNHLDKFNIHILSDHTALIGFLMNIFKDKIKLTNECKQIMSYYIKDKMINDIKCKTFLSNSAGELCDISDKICQEELNKNILNDTIIKNACKNNILLNSISTEEGIKNGIRKKNPMLLVHEIIKYLKENNMTDIKGV